MCELHAYRLKLTLVDDNANRVTFQLPGSAMRLHVWQHLAIVVGHAQVQVHVDKQPLPSASLKALVLRGSLEARFVSFTQRTPLFIGGAYSPNKKQAPPPLLLRPVPAQRVLLNATLLSSAARALKTP